MINLSDMCILIIACSRKRKLTANTQNDNYTTELPTMLIGFHGIVYLPQINKHEEQRNKGQLSFFYFSHSTNSLGSPSANLFNLYPLSLSIYLSLSLSLSLSFSPGFHALLGILQHTSFHINKYMIIALAQKQCKVFATGPYIYTGYTIVILTKAVQ